MRSIKIVGDELKGTAVLEDAETALRAATYVYFLGFGFDERNVQRLNAPQSIQNAVAVRATTFGWSASEVIAISRVLNNTPVHQHPVDVIGFMREYAEAFFQ